MHERDLLARCQAAVTACDAERGWKLTPTSCRHYAAAISVLLTVDATDSLIRDIATNYHADHALVWALRDARHANHDAAWSDWMRRALGVLRAKGFGRSDNTMLDPEDMAQVAYAALVRALPSYRYHSRFSSWAFRVIVQSAQNELRSARAEKRAVQPASLNDIAEHDHPADPTARDEDRANAHLLSGMIRAVFATQPDQRLGHIFHLWAVEDRRVAEIGALLRLHPSRVRALLREARTLLQANHAIRLWHGVEIVEAVNS
ncbi:MAG: sigma-70 family RNA polymerase sigma factor [Chloroflexales bacterium]|nr:sigma-70 family RNA polymerase sigma factor [Chloroflexales bacterium]